MPQQHLLSELLRFDSSKAIEEAWMPPSSWYVDPLFYELEQQAVFQRTWQPVARVADVAEPGSYVSGCLAGQPWVVVRDHDGELRAFHNVCRHKGMVVALGQGVTESLVCPYHGWTYDLGGTLRSAPRVAGIKDFDRGDMSLPSMAVETWGPWVFINGDADAAPLKPSIGELDRRLEESGWERLKLLGQRSWTIECNWKVYVDNYLDGGYHIPHMHPSLDAQLDMESYRTDLFDGFSIQTSGASVVDDNRTPVDPRQRIGAGAIYAWLYPNFMINRYGPCLDSNYVIPRGPDRCEVLYEFYFAEGSDSKEFVDQSMAQADVTQREDITISESVQIGLKSASYEQGRYAPRVEVGEHHFHCLLQRKLREALETP